MNTLYVMGNAHFGFANDFYNYVLQPRGFDVYRQKSVKGYYLKLLLKKYDVIWASSKARGFLTILMKRFPLLKEWMKNTKVITRFHREANAFFHESPEKGWMPYMAVVGSDEVVWVYDCFEELQQYIPQLTKSKFHVVHNGVDLDLYKPYPANRHEKTILTLSTWHSPKKCLDTLIDAMEHLPKWKLYIAGKFLDGAYEGYCRKLAKPHRNIQFLGFIDNKIQWMQKTDVFVLPSRQEAWSTQVMEAMACGCLVLAPKIGGMPQFVPKQELIAIPYSASDLADKIEELAQEKGLREENRKVVMPYTWTNIAKETEPVLANTQ